MAHRAIDTRLFRLALVVPAALVAAFALTGCRATGYTLEGRVIRGEISYVVVVEAGDPRLGEDAAPIPAALVRLETDPGRIQRELIGEVPTDADGNFSIRMNKMGSGILLYDVGITGRKAGHTTAFVATRLPPSHKRVLIMLAPGVDTFRDPYESDPLRDYERFR